MCEADIGYMTAVGTVLVTGSLENSKENPN